MYESIKSLYKFNKKTYYKMRDWSEIDLDKNKIRELLIDQYKHNTYNDIFNKLLSDNKINLIIDKIYLYLEENKDNKDNKDKINQLYPKPDFIFRAFQITPLDKIKVVIIGQDPYFNSEIYIRKHKSKESEIKVPQAYGLSFSVPYDFEIPSSLKNIYRNLIKFNHINKMPDNGCLDYLAYQGVMLLNTSFTVIDGLKNCHSNQWKYFTDEIIKYISKKSEYCIFVLWGNDAYKKHLMIDLDKHDIIVSSHPSGLSANKQMNSYPSFMDCDWFGQINKLLDKKKQKIFI